MTITWVGALLSLPAFLFLFAQLVEWSSGTQGTSGVYGDTFAQWSAVGLTAAIVGGPIVAIVMVLASSLRIREKSRDDEGVRATIDFHMSRGRLRVAMVSMLLLGGTVAFWFSQNWPCTYSNQWTC